MAVFLTILKIIGIVLLCIIGFVLLLLLLILLLPIRYRAEVNASDGDVVVDAKIKYLFFISVPISFAEKKLKVAAKVFGFKVFKIGYDDKKKDKEPDLEDEASIENIEATVLEAPKEKAEAVELKEDTIVINASKQDESVKSAEENNNMLEALNLFKEDSTDSEDDLDDDDENAEKEKKPLKQKILDLVDKGIHIYQAARECISTELNQVNTFIKRKSTKFTYLKVKKKLIKILKHVMPRKFEGDMTVGFDDPATTGYLCAGLSLIYGYYRNLDFTPDFTEKRIEGHVKIKGHIILGYIVWQGLTLIIRKKVRQFIKNVKQLLNDTKTNVNNVKESLSYGRSEI